MSQTQNQVLGAGRVYFNRFPDPAVKLEGTGERYLGNTPEFNLAIEIEKIEHFNSDDGIRTKDRTAVTAVNRTGSISCDNISMDNVALFFMGEVKKVTQTATAVVGEKIPAAKLAKDRYYQLGQTAANPPGVRDVTQVTIKSDESSGATTYTAGTDYVLDAKRGRFHIPSTSSIDVTKGLAIDYTPTANTRDRVISSGQRIEGSLRFEARNGMGENKDYYMPYVSLTANGDYALKGEDWQVMSFNLEILKLNDNTESIYVDGVAYTG